MKAVNVLTEFTSATGQTVSVFTKHAETISLSKPVPNVVVELSGFTNNDDGSLNDLVNWIEANQPPTSPPSSSTVLAPPHPAA